MCRVHLRLDSRHIQDVCPPFSRSVCYRIRALLYSTAYVYHVYSPPAIVLGRSTLQGLNT